MKATMYNTFKDLNAAETEKIRFYPVDMWEYMEVLYLNDNETGDGENDLEVDISGCYDYDGEEWDTEKIQAAAEKTVRDRFGDKAILVWG